jgi:hypothetical protein
MATWGSQTWGYENWGTLGDQSVSLTGISLSSNLNSVTVDTEINIGWGSDTWGYETWGTSGILVDVTGINFSANLGTLGAVGDASTIPTGQELTGTLGTALGSSTVDCPVTGQEMTATLQYQEAVVDVTGQELIANDGTATLDANTIAEVSNSVAGYWGYKSAWGYSTWGDGAIETLNMGMQEGDVDPAPDVSLTGNAAAMEQGSITTTADANISPTGQALTAAQGTATLDANTQVDVTGQAMAMQEGDETVSGNATVIPTGNALTMVEGSLKTLIWNQVNTGNAPVDPPGWQKIDTAA